MVLSFSKGWILKGNLLYNHNTGLRVYLGEKGLELIKKINENEGKIDLKNKNEKEFIEELKRISVLLEKEEFYPLEKTLPNLPPNFIEIELTRKCNFDCEYCYLKLFGNHRDKDIIGIVKRLINYPVLEITLTGGEPLLLGSRLKEIILLLRKNKIGVAIFTNGSLLNDEWIRFFKENNVRVYISLDTLRTDKDIRNSKLWLNVVRNVIKCKNFGCNITIQTTLQWSNLDNFTELLKFKEELGINIRYNLFLPISKDLKEKYFSLLPRFKEILEYNKKIPLSESSCGAGLWNIFVRSDGHVTPCGLFYNIIGGDILQQDLKEILEKPKDPLFKEIQKIANSKYPTSYLEFCRKCPLRFMCNSGCRARAYIINNNLYSQDLQKCYIEKEILLEKIIKDGYVLTLWSVLIDYSDVSEEFFTKALLRFLSDWEKVVRENYVLVAILNNKIEGVVIFNKKDKDIGTILWIVVSPKIRNKGIGSFLLKKAEEGLKELGCKKIRLPANKNALGFYLKHGYKIVKEETNYGEKIFILEKEI